MDKTAAGQYLDKLFGTREGYVAVAYKDKGQSWQECQFAWPKDRTKLIGWANVHQDANVFVCPALRRDAHTRKKGDMLPTRWLWADVDRQTIPADKLADVDTRIADIGTYIVSSGSGDNAHVYVELSAYVNHEEFIKLNTGLRDYLYGDNKQADNSLLRLPGTTNWKTDAGVPVAVRGGNGRSTTKANLMKRRAFRDAKVPVDVDASDWSMVEVEGVPRRVMAMTKMPVDEAIGRYGTRHKAVNAIVKELHKRGFDPDQIHSLLHTFPPAMDKTADENGYDLHHDIDRCIARLDQISDATPGLTTEERDEVIEEMETVSDEEFETGAVVEAGQRILRNRAATRWADEQEALARYTPLPDDVFERLDVALDAPAAPVQWLIEGLCSAEANVIITGQYKTGKTALMTNSLIRSLADGVPFLDKYEVHVPAGGVVVGHWNLEMGRTDLIDKYIRQAGIENPHNVRLANLRGYSVSLLTEPGKADAVKWLTSNGVVVWTIDSWAQLARMAGINSNDNDEVYALMGAIDEVKTRAGVQVCFLLGHTGRNADDKSSSSGGLNATRGASAIDEHVDARWVMTRDSTNMRYLAAEGRDVEPMAPTSLEFDEATKRMVIGEQTKSEVAADGLIQVVVRVLLDAGQPLNQADLVKRMRNHTKAGVAHCREVIVDAADAGFIEIKTEQRQAGGRPSRMHYLVTGPPKGDRTRQATPREINLTGEGRRRRPN